MRVIHRGPDIWNYCSALEYEGVSDHCISKSGLSITTRTKNCDASRMRPENHLKNLSKLSVASEE
jgi:hypothetical protein